MEQYSLWTRFIRFIKASYQERFVESFGGCLIGFFHAGNILYIGSNIHVAQWIVSSLVILKGLLIAGASSLTTSYVAYLFNKHIKKYLDGKTTRKKRKTQDRKAA
jgi:hypothetical protein